MSNRCTTLYVCAWPIRHAKWRKKSTISSGWKIVKNYNRWFFFLLLALVSNLYALHRVEKALECMGYIRWIIMVFCMLNLEYLNEGWRERQKLRNKQEKNVIKTERMEKKGYGKKKGPLSRRTSRLKRPPDDYLTKKSLGKKVHIAGKWSLYICHVYTAWAKKHLFV